MPGFDGTGPSGQGPMSGKGGGFCLMNVPDDPGESRTGYAGMAGMPVQVKGDPRATDLLMLRSRLREIQAGLDKIRSRLAARDFEKRRSAPPERREEKPWRRHPDSSKAGRRR